MLHKPIRRAAYEAVVKLGVSHIAHHKQVELPVRDKLGDGGYRMAYDNVGRELDPRGLRQRIRAFRGGLASALSSSTSSIEAGKRGISSTKIM